MTQYPQAFPALLRGQGLPAESSAVPELEEQALAGQAFSVPPGRATGVSEKCQGRPPLSCIFQQTANGNTGKEAAAGEQDAAAWYIAAAAAAWRVSSLATNC